MKLDNLEASLTLTWDCLMFPAASSPLQMNNAKVIVFKPSLRWPFIFLIHVQLSPVQFRGVLAMKVKQLLTITEPLCYPKNLSATNSSLNYVCREFKCVYNEVQSKIINNFFVHPVYFKLYLNYIWWLSIKYVLQLYINWVCPFWTRRAHRRATVGLD